MQPQEVSTDCQLTNLSHMLEGPQEEPSRGLRRLVRRVLGPRRVRALKNFANDRLDDYDRMKGKPPVDLTPYRGVELNPGDRVQVRDLPEIKATLNHFGQLKGCSFAPEMEQYCGTTQRVLKRVERFVDERDFKILKTKGIVLLEGINCPGVASLGRCDRNCFFFWRVEWLKKIEQPTD